MLFNSLHFLVFFPVVLILFYVLPHRWRWAMLLVASYYFYMGWNAAYASLLFITTTVDYFVARRIELCSEKRDRKRWLLLSLSANLGLLLYFKYYNFFIDNINHLSGSELKYMQFLLPVGISFYTFQEMGYVIDVYRGQLKAEKHYGKFALFVAYFPQLVAGPIERAGHLIHQLKQQVWLRYENFSKGIQFIIWGFFKKVVVADNLAIIVDTVYAQPENFGTNWLLLATYFFAFQIYCDFSGYSDIAIGVAKTMGIDLMENFRIPYLARSISEFWSRWHISLSTWFRDYLYIPLGGSRISEWRTNLNLFAVFAISGLWHGAAWTFIIWGILHGSYLVIENLLKKRERNSTNTIRGSIIIKAIRTIFIFHLVLFAWIFFRADSLGDAVTVIDGIFSFAPQQAELPVEILRLLYLGILFKAFFVVALFASDPWMRKILRSETHLTYTPKLLLFGFLLAVIVLFGNWGEVEFIYFQF
ncbi:MAG: MBOAT family O-acyltransferase [Flavobacteriales bacterium]|nr:MBOAT family O-acyltransferase [Flavobacteriales bacterium]